MSREVRVVADDLTGALDAAAPFAAPGQPVRVPWKLRSVPIGLSVATTSESRNAEKGVAVARTLQNFEELRAGGGGALWFKKVDSVLRGHPLAETAALMRAGGFRQCIFAPAFPEMGRVTRGGRQFVVGDGGARPVGPADLAAAFALEGLTARQPGHPRASEADVLVVDAETPEDLAEAARSYAGQDGVLWAGSRGLGAALAGSVRPCPIPRLGGVVVGTTHPATRAQVERLQGHVRSAGASGPLHLDPGQPLLLDATLQAASPSETKEAIHEALGRLEAPPDRELGIIVVGGDTLSAVLDATGTDALAVLGEVCPGIPLAQAQGGRLHGTNLITKSGGFGLPSLLRYLLSGRQPGGTSVA